MYLHHRLAHRYATTVVPGVTSVSAAAAAAGQPLVSLQESLTILPGVLAPDELKEALAGVDAAVVMKVGRHLADVREAAGVGRPGRPGRVRRAGQRRRRARPPPGRHRRRRRARTSRWCWSRARAWRGGTRTGDDRPRDRGRARPRPRRLVRAGRRSSGWPPPPTSSGTGPTSTSSRPPSPAGATARTTGWRPTGPAWRSTWPRRAATWSSCPRAIPACSPWPAPCWSSSTAIPTDGTGVEVEVLPGITAAQALASRVGAPLGHDFCVISLSDVLKPWSVDRAPARGRRRRPTS